MGPQSKSGTTLHFSALNKLPSAQSMIINLIHLCSSCAFPLLCPFWVKVTLMLTEELKNEVAQSNMLEQQAVLF